MCQCLICGCWWYNYCGVCCGGCHEASLIWSYWLCKPEDLRLIDPQCCHLCACDGCGYNCFYYGSILCAPRAVQEWSGLRSAGKTAADLNKNTIIINNTSPAFIAPAVSYQVTTTTTSGPGYGGENMNMNMNMGGGYGGNVGMNMNTNMGGANMNMNTNVGGGYGGVSMNTNMGGANVTMNTSMSGPSTNARINF